MEKELKVIAGKEAIFNTKLGIVTAIILCALIFLGIFAVTDTFYFIPMLCAFAIIITASVLLTIKKINFIKHSCFTWGEITNIEKSQPEASDVWQEFVIEYTDKVTGETYEVKRGNHFGDNEEELKKEIQEYYEEGQKLLGKRVPVLYETNKPGKTMVFFEKAE